MKSVIKKLFYYYVEGHIIGYHFAFKLNKVGDPILIEKVTTHTRSPTIVYAGSE